MILFLFNLFLWAMIYILELYTFYSKYSSNFNYYSKLPQTKIIARQR